MPFFIYSNYDGDDFEFSRLRERKLEEEWSDAARAAAAAARRYRGHGYIPRTVAAVKAFVAAGGKRGKKSSRRRNRANAAYGNKLWNHYLSLSDPTSY